VRAFFFVFVGLFFSLTSTYAHEQSIGLRNPKACGLYLSSLVEDSEGLYRSGLEPNEIRAYLESEQAQKDLRPVLVFKDRRTGKSIHEAAHLEEALESRNALPLINTKTINLVGVKLFGRERKELESLVQQILEEQWSDFDVQLRTLGRPEQPGLYLETEQGWKKVADLKIHQDGSSSFPGIQDFFENLDSENPDLKEKVLSYRLSGLSFQERFPRFFELLGKLWPTEKSGSQSLVEQTKHLIDQYQTEKDLRLGRESGLEYAFHRFVYFFPLPQDYQHFTRDEIAAGATKLAVNTPISVASLVMTNPAAVFVPVSIVNFGNSSLTAVYSVVLANWFSRSPREAHLERFGKNILLSAFFTVPLYWAGRGSWDAFSTITTGSAWLTFLQTKWSAVAFNVVWRFFFSNGTYKWEQMAKEKADLISRSDFESDESFLQAKQDVRNKARATRSRIETIASTIGTIGYLLAAVMPTNFVPEAWGGGHFEFGWGHMIMTGVGSVGAMIYFKPDLIDRLSVPDRLEKLHRGLMRMAAGVRASWAVQFLEKKVTAFYSRRAEREAQDGREFRKERDIREFFDLDDSLSRMLEENPNLIHLIHENPDLHRLLRDHPEYRAWIPQQEN
jgi:hypothetical protein